MCMLCPRQLKNGGPNFFAVLIEDGKEMSKSQEQDAFYRTLKRARPSQVASPMQYTYLRFLIHGNSGIKSTQLSKIFVFKKPIAK